MCLAIDIRVECLAWSFFVLRPHEAPHQIISDLLLLSQELILFIALLKFVDGDLLDSILGLLLQTILHRQVNAKVLDWSAHFLEEDFLLLEVDNGVVVGCLGVLVFTVLKITTHITTLYSVGLVSLLLMVVVVVIF